MDGWIELKEIWPPGPAGFRLYKTDYMAGCHTDNNFRGFTSYKRVGSF